MEDAADLQKRISALQGEIQRKKYRSEPYPTGAARGVNYSNFARGRGRGRYRGRGFGYGHQQLFQNRTLVTGGTQTAHPTHSMPTERADVPATPSASKEGWFIQSDSVGKRELMSKDTYEREQKQKEEFQQTRAMAAQQQRLPPTPTPKSNTAAKPKIEQASRHITIEGIDFQVIKDGSKLVRIHGSCSFGRDCRFGHDPNKVAICKSLLLHGTCPAGQYCDLSHEMSYHRVSACTHFLRGNCTNDACRYPHVSISASAPVCRAFATLGFCELGEACSRRHVVECPDYANHGLCTNEKCQLPHVDRASAMRKAAQRQAKIGLDGESDLSSDNDPSEDESELDEADGFDTAVESSLIDESHALSQQRDFVSLS